MATPIEQLELMENLEENFDGYGGSPPAGPVREMAKEFVKLIVAKREPTKRYDSVFVTPGRDASVLIEWDDDQYEHELEVNADGSLGFLHTEKVSGSNRIVNYNSYA
jgi:hypothetical protein